LGRAWECFCDSGPALCGACFRTLVSIIGLIRAWR